MPVRKDDIYKISGQLIFLLFLVGAAVLALPANAAAASGEVSASVLTVRSGPGTTYSVAGYLYQGTEINIIEESAGWYRIRFGNLYGWVSSQYVETSQKTPANMEPDKHDTGELFGIIVQDGPVNLRSGPSTSHSVIGMANNKERLSVIALAETEGWYQVRLANGQTGYVAGWLVKRESKPTQDAPNSADKPLSVFINGTKLSFDVPPIIENGTTLVPARAVFEALGVSVQWDQATSTVIAYNDLISVVLPIGATTATVNGKGREMGVPAKIIDDRTLVPLRFIAEAFEGEVEWNEKDRTITVRTQLEPDNGKNRVASVVVKENLVNLRTGPDITCETIDQACSGEKLYVLAEDNGWYQVSRAGKPAWVAGWVVDVAWEAGEPLTPQEPEENQPDSLTPASGEVVYSVQKDEKGLTIVVEAGTDVEPVIIKDDKTILLTYKNCKFKGQPVVFEPPGRQFIKISGYNVDNDAAVKIELPPGIEYSLRGERGSKQTISIPNSIVSVSREVCGTTGEIILIYTLAPCTYTAELKENGLEVYLESVAMGNVRETYEYVVSNLLEKMAIKQTDGRTPGTNLKIKTDKPFDYTIFQEEGTNELNIVLTIKSVEPSSRQKEFSIMLDPGHGGEDPGATCSNIKEKDINLSVALKAGELLAEKGIKVRYTRNSDVYLSLQERAILANQSNPDVFVSIHCNSFYLSDRNGTETYFYAPWDNEDLVQQRDQRIRLANLLQQCLVKELKRDNRGVKEAQFTVLKETKMPSALAELAFISNDEERRLLQQERFQERAARALADAIYEYFYPR
ncbi:MAG: N-acetylmuramoyl-L-alanine amidase [Syntrophomonadaceae bacterium]|jgi:N-acetylmuramoyl-L-alanine amidase